MPTQTINACICVCSGKDIQVFEKSSRAICKHIAAARYDVIVPEHEVELFKFYTAPQFNILSEKEVLPELNKKDIERILGNKTRAGWYLQQLLKIKALLLSPDQTINLIWDADTIPFRNIQFFTNEKLKYFKSTECHKPYFTHIQNTLGLEKKADFSFIAQCFLAPQLWVKDYVAALENVSGKKWYQAILENIAPNESSGFSEYESMGTFFLAHHASEMHITDEAWLRFGNSKIGLEQITEKLQSEYAQKYAYVSFELWDKVAKTPMDQFLNAYFLGKFPKNVIQVGANDGIMCDPLRTHIAESREDGSKLTLIEPIPCYFEPLQLLYAHRQEVTLINAACSKTEGNAQCWYIPRDIAKEMNGDGPQNNWAYGQGSFDKEILVKWINSNQFRGKEYNENIQHYINSIVSKDVKTIPLHLVLDSHTNENLLVVIDVQGHEIDVLQGITPPPPQTSHNSTLPQFIITEDDLKKSEVTAFLSSKGYVNINPGDDNLIFIDQNVVLNRPKWEKVFLHLLSIFSHHKIGRRLIFEYYLLVLKQKWMLETPSTRTLLSRFCRACLAKIKRKLLRRV